MLDRYVQALTQLSNFPVPAHWTERRADAQFKALMLLVVLDAIGSSAITENMIVPDHVLVGMFDTYWTRVTHLSPHQINAALAFYELRTEGFWHLIPRLGMERTIEAWGQPHSLGDLRQRVAGARIDDALYELLLDEVHWTALRRAVMWTYFTMSDWDEIESISAENRAHTRWQSHAALTLQTRSAPLPPTDEPVLGVETEPRIADAASTLESPGSSGALVKSLAAMASGDDAASSVPHLTLLSETAARIEEASAPEWPSGPLGTATGRPTQVADLDASGITTLGEIGQYLSAVFISPHEVTQAIFGGTRDVVWQVEMNTPAGTRQVTLAPSALESMPLVASHLCEKLGGTGYDRGADWPFVLDLSVRASNTLLRDGIRTVGDLAGQTVGHLLGLRNFGAITLEEVITAVRTELWPWLARFTLDELVPSHPIEQRSSAQPKAFDNAPVRALEAILDPRDRRSNALFVDVEAVLNSPWHYGPLIARRVLAALSTVGCDVDHTELRRVLLEGGNDGDRRDERVLMRAANVLAREDVHSLGDVARCSPAELLGMRQFGARCYRAVCTRVQAYLSLWLAHLNSEILEPGPIEGEAMVAQDEAHAADDQSDLSPATAREHITLDRGKDGDELHVVTPEPVSAFDRLRAAISLLRDAGASSATDRDSTVMIVTLLDALSVADLLDQLKDRMKARRELDVLLARAGVYDGEAKTLAQLGEWLHISRERVRQLELGAQRRLMDAAVMPDIATLGMLVTHVVTMLGGIAWVSRVANEIANLLPFGAVDPVCTTRMMASWSDSARLIQRDRLALSAYSDALISRAEAAIRETLASHPGGLPLNEFVLRTQLAGGDALLRVRREFVAALVYCTDGVEVVEGACQPAKRGSLYARMVGALRSLGRPAHFTEIAAAYRRLNPDESKRTDNAVHAFMDRYRDVFVLVGQGIFALSDWGYVPAIRDVASVVEHVLSQADRPLHKDEIVVRASERYRWKPNSLHAALQTDIWIVALGNGFYGLAGRDYGAFDSDTAYRDRFGKPRPASERSVKGTFTNSRGHRVVQITVSVRTVEGSFRISNVALRELFPHHGAFDAEAVVPDQMPMHLMLSRSTFDLSGLGRWLARVGAEPGDALFIERLSTHDGALAFRLAHGVAGNLAQAMIAVGLTPDHADHEALDGRVLRRTRDPERLLGSVEHLLAHPWSSPELVCAALGFAPGMPHGAEYLALGAASGVLAHGVVAGAPGNGEVVRPTGRGVAWLARRQEPLEAARTLVLGLPAYRAHLRMKWGRQGADGTESGEDGGRDAQLLAPKLTKVWDEQIALATGLYPAELDAAPAIVSTISLPGDALALLLLLLCAQSRGAGVALGAIREYGLADVETALRRLRLLGLYLVHDENRQSLGLAERVLLAVDAPDEVARRLRQLGSDMGKALGAVVGQALRVANAGMPASDLAGELQARSESLFNAVLASAPANVPEGARFADGEIVLCGFVPLAADWGLCPDVGAEPPFAFLCDALANQGEREAKVTVCLGQELIGQEWTADRHLAANAHLALLVLAAGDMGGLAERIARGEGGWRLDGVPLVMALDVMLRGLGYDIWDAAYRDDPALVNVLGDELIGLGERLGLIATNGTALDAEGALASAVYYRAYALVGRMVETLTHPRVVG